MPTPAAQFLSGKNGRAAINGSVVKIKRWKVDPKAEKIDITNSISGGYGEPIGGIVECDWEFDFDYYVTSAPFNLAPPGTYISNVVFNIGDPGLSTFWQFPVALVESGSCESRVRGKVEGTIRGCSVARFIKPVF